MRFSFVSWVYYFIHRCTAFNTTKLSTRSYPGDQANVLPYLPHPSSSSIRSFSKNPTIFLAASMPTIGSSS